MCVYVCMYIYTQKYIDKIVCVCVFTFSFFSLFIFPFFLIHFSFYKNVSSLQLLHEACEKIRSGKMNDDNWPAPAEWMEPDALDAYLRTCPEAYVQRSSPRRFLKQAELYVPTFQDFFFKKFWGRFKDESNPSILQVSLHPRHGECWCKC